MVCNAYEPDALRVDMVELDNARRVAPFEFEAMSFCRRKRQRWANMHTRLIAVNAVSLVFALMANFSLLLNMARRLSFAIAQPITICGFYIASILLIALVATTSESLKLPAGERRALTGAFYYAIMAAGLYFVIASLMVVTVYGAFRGEYPKAFKLSMSQRTLMLQTMSFMVYLLGGAGMFAKVEGWLYPDAVYFADYTLLTIGIGDYAPATHLGRGLTIPFAIGGIVILGLVIGSIRSLVLERGKAKIGSRMVEKKREKLLERIEKGDRSEMLSPLRSESQASELGLSEKDRRRKEFELMRQVQHSAATKQKWNSLFISATATFALWFIGALVFYKAEYEQGWT